MSRKKKISRISETRVKEWAEKNDAAVNSSDPDEFGWDHYIEFEATHVHETLAQLHTSPLKCKAQIKATDAAGGNRQLTLSSLKHVATDTIPAFIIFVEYYKKNKPQNVYVTHIGEEITYQILSRCAKAKSKDRKLNQSKYKIPDEYRKLIQKPYGKNLIRYIKECIGGSMESYQVGKMSYLSKLGFEGGKIKTTFTLPNVREAIQQSLHGNEQYVRVDEFHHTIHRFGVEEAPELLNNGQLWIKVIARDDPINARLTIVGNERTGDIEFSVNLINTKINHFLPPEKRTLLIEGDCFEITVENVDALESSGVFSITGKNSSQVQLHEIAKYFRLLSRLSDSEEQLTVWITFDSTVVSETDNREVTAKYRIGPARAEESFDVTEELDVLDKIAKACITEASYSNLNISLEEFQKVFCHAKTVFEMYETITTNVQGDKLSTKLLDGVKKTTKYSIVMTLICPIGNYYFSSIITVSSDNITISDEHELLLDNCQVEVNLKELIRTEKINAVYKSKIIGIFAKVIEARESQGYTAITPKTLG